MESNPTLEILLKHRSSGDGLLWRLLLWKAVPHKK